MANRNLFKSAQTRAPAADKFNLAGGIAYQLSPRHALAQIAMTGTFNGTFYASPEDILELAKKITLECKDDPKYIAQVAIGSRESGYMKDLPAFLVAMLSEIDTKLFRRIFNRVIDNGKMLRNVIQMARSGQLGKVHNVSAGTYRRAIQNWFNARSPISIWKASIGNCPSMRDILRMSRPKPNTAAKAALYAYLLGAEINDGKLSVFGPKDAQGNPTLREHDCTLLPELIRQYETYKNTKEGDLPDVDWRFLDSLELGDAEWIEIAKKASWQMTRQNLNTFVRHGVFKDKIATTIVAERLASEEEIKKARVFPYQIMTTWKAASDNVPVEVREALQDAMEIATANIAIIGGKLFICMDVSGSMRWGIAPRKDRRQNLYGGWESDPHIPQCVDAAALFAASLARANPNCEIIPFSNMLHPVNINPRDTVLTNARILASLPAGGTNCSLPLAHLNQLQAKGDAVIFVSDYESWIDSPPGPGRYSDGTKLHEEWLKFKQRNKHAKMICLDLTPRDNGQVKERPDVLQIGGFSDRVFEVVKGFLEDNQDSNYWVHHIQQIDLDKCEERV